MHIMTGTIIGADRAIFREGQEFGTGLPVVRNKCCPGVLIFIGSKTCPAGEQKSRFCMRHKNSFNFLLVSCHSLVRVEVNTVKHVKTGTRL